MDVIFDNSSDYLALSGQKCNNCEGTLFIDSQSSTATYIGSKESERTYNDVTVKGTEWLDTVCLNSNTCVDNFEFFMINSSVNTLNS